MVWLSLCSSNGMILCEVGYPRGRGGAGNKCARSAKVPALDFALRELAANEV
jgi:hypothetical protein